MDGQLITNKKRCLLAKKGIDSPLFCFLTMFKTWLYSIILLGSLVASATIIYFVYYTHEKIVIAVIDTGVDFKQIKFRFVATKGFNILEPNRSSQDDNGHGTQVASIIHYLEPHIKIMPIKAIPRSGVATKKELAQGIITAVNLGAKIINISAGVVSSSSDLENAVNYAEKRGVLVVAAVGGGGSGIEYPAAYPTVLAVGGIDGNGTRLTNSNIGHELDIMALGEYVSIGLRGKCLAGAGTSLATPIVSVYLARILLNNPNYTPQQTRDILLSSAIDIEKPGVDDETGYGLLKQKEVTLEMCN